MATFHNLVIFIKHGDQPIYSHLPRDPLGGKSSFCWSCRGSDRWKLHRSLPHHCYNHLNEAFCGSLSHKHLFWSHQFLGMNVFSKSFQRACVPQWFSHLHKHAKCILTGEGLGNVTQSSSITALEWSFCGSLLGFGQINIFAPLESQGQIVGSRESQNGRKK